MNVDSRIITLALFLIAQSVGAIWWASGLSSEVERLSGLVDKSDQFQTEIQRAVSGLDVLNFKVEELWKAIERLEEADIVLREVDNEIMTQHEVIFSWLAEGEAEQTVKETHMTEGDPVSLSDRTSVGMPIRNLIGLIGTVCVGAWGYFGILERLNVVETNQILMSADVTKNSTFTEKWPRGELGALPADAEQFMLIEHLSGEFEKLLDNVESGNAPFDRQQALTLDFYRQRIEALEAKVEILKDKVALLKSQNGIH